MGPVKCSRSRVPVLRGGEPVCSVGEEEVSGCCGERASRKRSEDEYLRWKEDLSRAVTLSDSEKESSIAAATVGGVEEEAAGGVAEGETVQLAVQVAAQHPKQVADGRGGVVALTATNEDEEMEVPPEQRMEVALQSLHKLSTAEGLKKMGEIAALIEAARKNQREEDAAGSSANGSGTSRDGEQSSEAATDRFQLGGEGAAERVACNHPLRVVGIPAVAKMLDAVPATANPGRKTETNALSGLSAPKDGCRQGADGLAGDGMREREGERRKVDLTHNGREKTVGCTAPDQQQRLRGTVGEREAANLKSAASEQDGPSRAVPPGSNRVAR